jgi:flagellar basal body-associated protein FliL
LRKRKKKSKKSTFLILIIVLLFLLSIAFIYHKNPTVIDNFPIVTGKQPEPIVTTPSPSVIPNDTIKVGAFNLQIYGKS